MKKIYFLILMSIMLISCNQAGDKASTSGEEQNETTVQALKTIRLSVTGMTCEGCENSVETALTKLEGVTAATASHIEKFAEVSYDSTKVTAQLLEETINNLGYQVEK